MTDCEDIPSAPQTPGTPGAPLFGVRVDKGSSGKRTLLHGCNSCLSIEGWAEEHMLSDLPAALPSASLAKKVFHCEFLDAILIFVFRSLGNLRILSCNSYISIIVMCQWY